MKKTIFLIFISLLLHPCFAERKTRVDSYGHQQIKIIWNTNYTSGPDDTNWAERSWGEGWTNALRYEFIINPKILQIILQEPKLLYIQTIMQDITIINMP